MNSAMIQRILDRESYRIEAALEKNFDYLERLDRAREEAILNAQNRSSQTNGSSSGKLKDRNTGVYITGLTTYIACKQLENLCHRLGRVKRIKFYKDERGSLKGDALVVFATTMTKEAAIAKVRVSKQLNKIEIKPGVQITAKPAEYNQKNESEGDPLSIPKESTPENNPDDLVNAFLQDVQAQLGGVLPPKPTEPQPVPQETAPQAIEVDNTLDNPSRSIVLRGVFDDETSSDEFLDLEEDLHSECSKYGSVVKVSIQAEVQLVAVEFAALDSAIECLKVMNGRWFGGQQIQASFDPSKPEASEDPDLMLQAFLASV